MLEVEIVLIKHRIFYLQSRRGSRGNERTFKQVAKHFPRPAKAHPMTVGSKERVFSGETSLRRNGKNRIGRLLIRACEFLRGLGLPCY